MRLWLREILLMQLRLQLLLLPTLLYSYSRLLKINKS
jgi:hypothetical protein